MEAKTNLSRKYDYREATTVDIGCDDETITKVDVELTIEHGCVTKCVFPPDFDKESHGMWQMELSQQLREQGYNTEYL